METKIIQPVKFPETLVEAIRQFSNLDYATAFFAAIRWPDGAHCPHCGSAAVDYIANRRVWQCRENHPRAQFSVKIGTVFEECRLPIDKCLIAVWLEINAKNSISSYEIHRHLKVTQKTAWFLLHRIRHALHVGSFDKKMSGIVEADETFIGGAAKNMHRGRHARCIKGQPMNGKAAVMGLLERHTDKRHSTVRAEVIQDRTAATLHPIIHKHVQTGEIVFTDSLSAYRGLEASYAHRFVDHAERYVNGIVHTNGLENFWSLFKRCIKGTHVSIEPFHLAAYVDSEAFRFNNRKLDDAGRFASAIKGFDGKRLTYKALIGALGDRVLSDKIEERDSIN